MNPVRPQRTFLFLLIGSLFFITLWTFVRAKTASSDFLKKKSVKLGKPVADFYLPSMEGETYRLSTFKGKIVVIDFWSAECPASARYDEYFNWLQSKYQDKGVQFLMIDSNAAYDSTKITRVVKERKIQFTILKDYGNVIADQLGAITTPHIFIIDREGILVYEGAVDDQSWAKTKPTINYLEKALEDLLQGKSPQTPQTQSFGCTIKRAKKS